MSVGTFDLSFLSPDDQAIVDSAFAMMHDFENSTVQQLRNPINMLLLDKILPRVTQLTQEALDSARAAMKTKIEIISRPDHDPGSSTTTELKSALSSQCVANQRTSFLHQLQLNLQQWRRIIYELTNEDS